MKEAEACAPPDRTSMVCNLCRLTIYLCKRGVRQWEFRQVAKVSTSCIFSQAPLNVVVWASTERGASQPIPAVGLLEHTEFGQNLFFGIAAFGKLPFGSGKFHDLVAEAAVGIGVLDKVKVDVTEVSSRKR